MSVDPSFPPYNYFAVASYEVAVRRYPDSNGTSGLARTLSLASTASDTQQERVFIWFGPFSESSPTVGTVYTASTPVELIVNLPIGEIELWLDVLKGDRQVYFEYFWSGRHISGGRSRRCSSVAFTTEHNPGGSPRCDAAASSTRALHRNPDEHATGCSATRYHAVLAWAAVSSRSTARSSGC